MTPLTEEDKRSFSRFAAADLVYVHRYFNDNMCEPEDTEEDIQYMKGTTFAFEEFYNYGPELHNKLNIEEPYDPYEKTSREFTEAWEKGYNETKAKYDDMAEKVYNWLETLNDAQQRIVIKQVLEDKWLFSQGNPFLRCDGDELLGFSVSVCCGDWFYYACAWGTEVPTERLEEVQAYIDKWPVYGDRLWATLEEQLQPILPRVERMIEAHPDMPIKDHVVDLTFRLEK